MKILLSLCFALLPIRLVLAQNVFQHIDSLREVYHIPALAVAVVTDDSIPLTFVCGYRNNVTREPASSGDLFHIGSNTKAITSFIAAKLVEEKKIRWDSKFFEVLPEANTGSRSHYKNITLEQLLSHRAGIRPFTDGKDFTTLPSFTGSPSEQRKMFGLWLLKQKSVKPQHGEQYVYSNAGYAVAAVMLEQLTGKSWEDLVREHMRDSLHINVSFGWPNRQNIHEPWGHVEQGDSLVPTPPDDPYRLNSLIEPAGDIAMSVSDYARLIQLHLRGLRGRTGYLLPESFLRMHYSFPEYSLGWGWVLQNGNHISFHDGSAGTFFCHTILSKEKNIGLILMCNAYSDEVVKGIHVIQMYLEKKYAN